jgi:hypothetical protein
LLFPEGQINLSDEDEDGDNQATIRAAREIAPPPRISSLFKDVNYALLNRDIYLEPQAHADNQVDNNTSVLPNDSGKLSADMDPLRIADLVRSDNTTADPSADYTTLDSKLKAIDDNVKLVKKQAKSKKRKSGVPSDDLTYKPSVDDGNDDEAEWEAASRTPKKKRKSDGKSENDSRGQAQKITVQKLTPATATIVKSHVTTSHKQQKVDKVTSKQSEGDREIRRSTIDEIEASDEVPLTIPVFDGEPEPEDSLLEVTDLEILGPLEPVVEEEEENDSEAGNTTTTSIPIKDVPSKPTAKATPARYTRHGAHPRNRSVSAKQSQQQQYLDPSKSGIQSVISAGDIARHRRNRSISPLPPFAENIDDQSRPAPDSTATRPATAPTGDFEWPEDVF